MASTAFGWTWKYAPDVLIPREGVCPVPLDDQLPHGIARRCLDVDAGHLATPIRVVEL